VIQIGALFLPSVMEQILGNFKQQTELKKLIPMLGFLDDNKVKIALGWFVVKYLGKFLNFVFMMRNLYRLKNDVRLIDRGDKMKKPKGKKIYEGELGKFVEVDEIVTAPYILSEDKSIIKNDFEDYIKTAPVVSDDEDENRFMGAERINVSEMDGKTITRKVQKFELNQDLDEEDLKYNVDESRNIQFSYMNRNVHNTTVDYFLTKEFSWINYFKCAPFVWEANFDWLVRKIKVKELFNCDNLNMTDVRLDLHSHGPIKHNNSMMTRYRCTTYKCESWFNDETVTKRDMFASQTLVNNLATTRVVGKNIRPELVYQTILTAVNNTSTVNVPRHLITKGINVFDDTADVLLHLYNYNVYNCRRDILSNL
jgi:hypothetical protein